MQLNNPLLRRNSKIDRQSGKLRIYDYRFYIRHPWVKGRALLCLLPDPVLADMNGEKIIRFSNSGFGLAWARVLNELGYALDIINWDDIDFKPQDNYDLIVFHGAKSFPSVYNNLKNKPRIIHFLSGSYWKFNNSQEDRRIKNFEKRHGVKIERDRFIYESEDPVSEVSEGIIVLGDASMADTYPKNPPVLTINNASYPDSHFDRIKKDYELTRRNFLYFAGGGNIHKGLDLVIDAFKDLEEENLYIVTVPDKKVLSAFKKQLELPNIHLIGQVEMRTPEFYDAMDKCAYVILPSCSEGQAGSVVEAMNQGLIPIVSKETRLDSHGYGVLLKNNSIQEIKRTVMRMASLNPEEVQRLSRKTRSVAVTEHTPVNFRKTLKLHIKRILGE